MSAFVVAKAHIDYLVSAGFHLGPGSSKLRWWASPPEAIADEEERQRFRYDYDANLHELTWDNAGMVGAMLWAENMRSVNYRYEEAEVEEPYLFCEVDTEPLQTLKAISCYDYQTCEHPGWLLSEARQFCLSLQDHMIGKLPGYDDRAWELLQAHPIRRIITP